MGRKFKNHNERRNEILDAAWELFTNRGYEGTPVAAIISKLDISKGTFYHYFTSKEEVLDAITDRLSAEALAELRPIVDDPDLDPGSKLNRFLEIARQSRLRRVTSIVAVTRVLYRDKNLIIRHKINERLFHKTLPLLQSIVEEGITQGIFHVSDTVEAARFFLLISNSFADQQTKTLLSSETIETKVKELHKRAEFAVQSLERMLGAEPGLIACPSRNVLELFAQAFEKR